MENEGKAPDNLPIYHPCQNASCLTAQMEKSLAREEVGENIQNVLKFPDNVL